MSSSVQPLNLYLALFDWADETRSELHWTWRHPGIGVKRTQDFYSYVVAPELARSPLKAATTVLSAGYASIDAEFCCWFRLFDAGRDLAGRPGRFLMPVVFARRREAASIDAVEIWNSEPFRAVAALAKSQVRPPLSISLPLEFVIHPKRHALSDSAIQRLRASNGPLGISRDTLTAISVACSCSAAQERWRLLMATLDSSASGSVTFQERAEPPFTSAPLHSRPADLPGQPSREHLRAPDSLLKPNTTSTRRIPTFVVASLAALLIVATIGAIGVAVRAPFQRFFVNRRYDSFSREIKAMVEPTGSSDSQSDAARWQQFYLKLEDVPQNNGSVKNLGQAGRAAVAEASIPSFDELQSAWQAALDDVPNGTLQETLVACKNWWMTYEVPLRKADLTRNLGAAVRSGQWRKAFDVLAGSGLDEYVTLGNHGNAELRNDQPKAKRRSQSRAASIPLQTSAAKVGRHYLDMAEKEASPELQVHLRQIAEHWKSVAERRKMQLREVTIAFVFWSANWPRSDWLRSDQVASHLRAYLVELEQRDQQRKAI